MAKESVLFVCKDYPVLTMTITSERVIEVEGKAVRVPGKKVHFQKMAFGGEWRGELKTSDQEVIDFIRGHDWFGTHIIEAKDPDVRVAPEPMVRTGARGTGAHEEAPEAPAETPANPKAAKVPAAIRRGRPPKVAPVGV